MKKADITKFDSNGAGNAKAGIFGLPFNSDESNIILMPVPWEVTTSYGRGTVNGPQAIFSASPQLDLFDADYGSIGLHRPWEYGIHFLPVDKKIHSWNKKGCAMAKPIIERGGEIGKSALLKKNLQQVNILSAQLNELVKNTFETWQNRGKIVGLVGGDHSVSLGAIAAAARRWPDLGIVHIDAHADLRNAYEGFTYSHASIMYNVLNEVPGVSALVQVGIRDFCDSEYSLSQNDPRVKTYFDAQIRDHICNGKSWANLVDTMIAQLPENIYISFDIDGLDPALCPHTGTPVPGGLSFGQALFLIKALTKKRIVGFDLNEVAPGKKDEWDGNVGSRILYKLCGAALLSQGARN